MALDMDKLLNARMVCVGYLPTKDVNAQMLKDIMENNGISSSTLANVLGIRKTTLLRYLDGKPIPSGNKMLIALINEYPKVINMIMSFEIVVGK